MVGILPPARDSTPDDRNEIVAPVVGGLADLVFGRPGLFVDRPGFVNGGGSQDPLPSIVRDLTRLNCRIWASRDKSGYSARVNAGNAELCGPYLDSLNENPTPGSIGPPFSGGQCLVRYAVVASWNNTNTNGTPSSTQQQTITVSGVGAPGPIRGVERRGQPGSWSLWLLHGTDAQFPVPESSRRTSSATTQSFLNLKIVSVTRIDGQADSCGDPVPKIRPPATVTPTTPIPPDINIDLPGYGPVTVTVNPDVDGDPIVCFEEVQVCVTVKPDVDAPGGGGGDPPPPTDPPPGDIGSPGGAEDTGEGGSASGCAPDGSVLVGIKIDVLATPPSPKTFAPGVFRGACYVYMGTSGNLDHDPAGSMLRNGQFIFAEKDNLTCFEVNANTGYRLRVTPYYREVSQ